jgi:hypothetical protein
LGCEYHRAPACLASIQTTIPNRSEVHV